MWRGGLGGAYRLPTLSSVGASLAPPCLRFHTPLVEPDVRICRIRLSEKRFTVSPTGNYSSAWQGGRGPALRAEMTAETAWSPTPPPCAWHITTDAASCKRDCPPLEALLTGPRQK